MHRTPSKPQPQVLEVAELDLSSLESARTFAPTTWATSRSPTNAYSQSKLANAIFTIELDRRLRAAGSSIISVFAHPGYSATNLQSTGPVGVAARIMKIGNALVAQKADRGALPQLYSATAPAVHGGQFFGPSGRGELRGDPVEVQAIPAAYDPAVARRLWLVSEELTGVTYPLPGASQ